VVEVLDYLLLAINYDFSVKNTYSKTSNSNILYYNFSYLYKCNFIVCILWEVKRRIYYYCCLPLLLLLITIIIIISSSSNICTSYHTAFLPAAVVEVVLLLLVLPRSLALLLLVLILPEVGLDTALLCGVMFFGPVMPFGSLLRDK
jgi:hypothetical protein